MPSLPAPELDERLERRRTADKPSWALAQHRETVLREMMAGDGTVTARTRAAAQALQRSVRTVQRLIVRYKSSAQTTSLIPNPPGPRKARRRLGAERERIVDEAIERRYLVRPRTPMEATYREVTRQCRRRHLPVPSRNSIIKRIRALDARLVARKRLGAKAAEAIALSTPGALEASHALEIIQIDHTLADVMIVDSVNRRCIGRPWLTLAIDVATRSVLGFHVGLEAPSSLCVALCLEHAVLPKKPPANASGQPVSWDMFGLPLNIHVDNGAEFHGEALRRGCTEYGITLLHRPVARPRFGAHIERLIGTMMGKVHLLPGSTDASPAGRGGYDAEKEAALTLAELREWLYLEIAGKYHHSIHRMLGTTPAAAWNQSLATGICPSLPTDPQRFVIGFLPVIHRRLQRDGIHFERIRYWADVLPALAQPRERLLIRYDPRNLSRLYVLGPDACYHAVPYVDVRRPPISLAELRHAHALLHKDARGLIDEERLFAAHERQTQLVIGATRVSKAARRRIEPRRAPLLIEARALNMIDYSKEPIPLPSEIWESKS